MNIFWKGILILTGLLLMGALPVYAQPLAANTLSPEGQLGPPDWGFETNVSPNMIMDHRRMVVSEGCDVNGDGFEDILVGRRDFDYGGVVHAGRAWLFLGGPNGLHEAPDLILNPPVGTTTYGFFGTTVACAGNVNGDDYEDFLVGMDNYDEYENDEGAVFLYHGGADIPDSTADWYARGVNEWAHFGIAIDGAGDVNGDGYDDIIVGAGEDYSYSGRDVYVWYGSSNGLGDSGLPTNADWYASGPGTASGFGMNVQGIGDFNGDGFDDVLVGAPYFDSPTYTNMGGVFVWLGAAGPAGLGTNGTMSNYDWKATGEQASAYLGYGADGIGDVDGDGFDDLGVGAYAYDNGETNEGKAFVWYGSDPLPANGTPANAAWSAESNTAGSYLGFVLHTAKDVNGDGYAEILITAPNYPAPDGSGGSLAAAGVMFAWLGSESGLGDAGTPGNADLTMSSNQATSYLGRDEAGAAYSHGDRLSDLFVVARDYDSGQTDEGIVAGWSPAERQYIFLPVVLR